MLQISLLQSIGLLQLQTIKIKRYMLTIQEIITHLQSKISTYRTAQQKITTLSHKIKPPTSPSLQTQTLQTYKQSILHILNSYKKDTTQQVIQLSMHYQGLIRKIKKQCELQIDDINRDRQRQYNCIRKMKEDIFTLHELIKNIQEGKQDGNDGQMQGQRSRNQYQNHHNQHQHGQYNNPNHNHNYNDQNMNHNHNHDMINGLEIIVQQETQRTLVSSVRSYTDQYRYPIDPFIKIQQKSQTEYEEYDRNGIKTQKESRIISPQPQQNHHLQTDQLNDQITSNQFQFHREKPLSKSQNSSMRKLQKLLADSNIQQSRQNTHQYELISQESYGQYQSLPLSVQGCQSREFHNRQDFHTWNGKKITKELRDITNENQQRNDVERQRQEKTKMFLQQFRKTFSKCLSSATVSRKTSLKQQKPSNNGNKINKSRQERSNKTSKDISLILKDGDKMQNQKMINEMLKDIDNNNKFLVGNRKIELKYQGEKKDGVRHGKGILYYSNGLCYQGQFRNNARHGTGILRFNLVQLYRGQWLNDELSGQGKLRNFAVINSKRNHTNSSTLERWGSYYGYFKNNRFQGEGTLYLSGGQKFLGKFICGMACGEGILYKKSGEVENGIWRNNQLVERF